ncbi:hypothetical protein ECC02_008341 [Trypanosoma cruzi]|uniref:diphosphoinositol-polyphosphate diphosphatase n=1 Tax=Trypanosoma cruzi TaxID=5693 RepID=A0A7J6XWV9_TRYCR|nr:hypothetical protein ECC02_008341 [Trypanosoma cruzi]
MTAPLSSSSVLAPRQMPSAIQEPLVPSINFAMVCPGVYRSGYPTRKNFRFLRALRLRTILYLCPEEYAESNVKFCEENDIRILRFATEGNKEPFMDISEPLMHRILSALVDTRTHPILIHCNKGKHRTGAVVACLRLLQGWSLVSIFQEYRCFAGDKARMGDQQYVELYHPIVLVAPASVAEWMCITRRVTVVQTEQELLEAESQQLGWSLVAPPPLPPSPPSLQEREKQQQKPKQQEEVQKQQSQRPPLLPSAAKGTAQCSHREGSGKNAKNDAAKLPVKSSAATATVSSSTSMISIPAPRRAGGQGESGIDSGKTKETNSIPRKENGDRRAKNDANLQ